MSHDKNSIWGCSVTAGFVGLEKGIHSLWNPAGLIHEITEIILPPHPRVHKCLLLVSQHHICSVVTPDDAGCNSVGHPRLQPCANTALGSPRHQTIIPLWFSVCSSASSFSLAIGVKAVSWDASSSLVCNLLPGKSTQRSPISPVNTTASRRCEPACNAEQGHECMARMECLVSTFFHAGLEGSLVAGTGMLPTYGSQLMRPALPTRYTNTCRECQGSCDAQPTIFLVCFLMQYTQLLDY